MPGPTHCATNIQQMSLKLRLAIRMVLVQLLVPAMMFLAAWTLRFWQGWVFTGIFLVFNLILVVYFGRRDPKLLERRMEHKEPRRQQKQFKMLWLPLWICTLVLPGLDYRFGWSVRLMGGVALWETVVSLVLIVVGWVVVFHVMRFNSYASAIVKVEEGQKVITDGPYRLVRHPMYTGFALMILGTPWALGSWVALIPALPLIPVLIFRLLDEERVLRRELPGYAEYCGRTASA